MFAIGSLPPPSGPCPELYFCNGENHHILLAVLYSVWLFGLLIGLLRYGMEDGVKRD